MAGRYLNLLLQLLPPGFAWSRKDGDLPKLLDGASQELSRLDDQATLLTTEMDTRYTSQLLAEHEQDFGITPPAGATEAERQAALQAAKLAMGGQNPAYYIAVAKGMGYTITIDQFKPAWCGVFKCGEGCGEQDNIFYWRVNVKYDKNRPTAVGDDLREVLERLQPAQMTLLMQLVNPAFSAGFSNGFDALPAANLTQGGFNRRGFGIGFDVWHGGGFAGYGFGNGYQAEG